MPLREMFRLFHTVRHLKTKQVIYRLYYRYTRTPPTEEKAYGRRTWLNAWAAPGLLPPVMLPGGRFEMLGEAGDLRGSDAWNDSRRSKLWLYNLHYLDDLNAVGAEFRREEHRNLVNRWIAENPPATGIGWEPYPLSLRIVNLVKWFARQDALEPAWLESLARQGRVLFRRPEYHLLGNHLFANAKALVFAGAFLSGDEPEKWLKKGLRVLDREIPEQFLPDGGHFELSPMYHAILLVDLCDLLNLAERSGLGALKERVAGWRDVVNRGLAWLATMSHPDGHIAFFNDAAFGIAADIGVTNAYAAGLGCNPDRSSSNKSSGDRNISVQWLENSGYCRAEMPDGVALLDIARIGPDYLPGHGHADTLSFELSLFGQRVFVNSGTSRYGEDAERQRQRGTAAHNTVTVDATNSSEVWRGFRVARRAYPSRPCITEGRESLVISASHDGYKRLRGKNIHWRSWTFAERSMVIQDLITGRFSMAEAYFHLHPDIRVDRDHSSDNRLLLLLGSGKTVNFSVQGAAGVEIVESSWHPAFGMSVPSTCIVVKFGGQEVSTRIGWGDNT